MKHIHVDEARALANQIKNRIHKYVKTEKPLISAAEAAVQAGKPIPVAASKLLVTALKLITQIHSDCAKRLNDDDSTS